MIVPRPEDAVHKVHLYRLLTALIDDSLMVRHIYFKGGTCASMLGYLDRFSIDLDFDMRKGSDKALLRTRLTKLFERIEMQVYDESEEALLYVLKYEAPERKRNTLKLEIIDQPAFEVTRYVPHYFSEIDRYIPCQSLTSMVAHKLVSLTDRYAKHHVLAGRDVYDIHHFLLQGYRYEEAIILARTGKHAHDYFIQLYDFIDTHVTQTVIDEDLNYLLHPVAFTKMRRILKSETLQLVKDEIERTKSK